MANANATGTFGTPARPGLLNDSGIKAFANWMKDNPGLAVTDLTRVTTDPDPDKFTTDSLQAVVNKINNTVSSASGIEAEATSINTLRIWKNVVNQNEVLKISTTSSIDVLNSLGISSNQEGDLSSKTEDVNLLVADVVEKINDAGLAGVSATQNNTNVEIRSINESLEIGAGTANGSIGLSAGRILANTLQSLVKIDLNILDVAEQINDAGIDGVTASVVNGSLIIKHDGDQMTIGDGSVNSLIGISEGDFHGHGDTIENSFNTGDWTVIPDPADFSISVINTIGSDGLNASSSADYDILRTIDLNLEVKHICAGMESGDDAMIEVSKPHHLSIGDYVLVLNSSSSPSIDGIHKVINVKSGGSESKGFFIDKYIEESGFDGKVIPIRSVKFSNTNAANAIGNDPRYVDSTSGAGISNGALIYVDRENE